MVDHCYTDIGCFPLSPEFYHPRHRPWNVRPWHRNRINTRFELYNRLHPNGFDLNAWDALNLGASGFNPRLETKVLIPGWLDSIKRTVWIKRAKEVFLWHWNPVNLIVVHWHNFTPYTIATANSRVVGAELANLIQWLERESNYDRTYYHLIGHSLGAHIGGYCGDRVPGLGRITALDPARPYFQHMPKSVRLDRGDALFVDAIHSDFTPENAIFLLMSFGMTTPVGHVDFYPNGPPLLQPGCLRDTILSARNGIRRGLEYSSLSVAFMEAIRYLTACDHQRSHEWFVESLTNRQCLFVGVRCNDFDGLINGRCTCDDSPSACAIMGIHADQMYLNRVHNDLWPLKSASESGSGSGSASNANYPSPLRAGHNSQAYVTTGAELFPKDEIYSQMKHFASKKRQPKSAAPTYDEFLLSDFAGIRDPTFIRYLLTNFISSESPVQVQFSGSPAIEPINSVHSIHSINPNDLNPWNVDELELLLHSTSSSSPFESNHILEANHQVRHPLLMSDMDRDIEQWYEDSSRWYLKTNNRPSYCVNQYQVLVYMGPLVTETGHDYLKANLIISIIGSRGKLINQRFVPRAARLSSFTLQPFFIILEGSYSLGNIVSVAVAWEARRDPDPVQATVSFNSGTLDVAQSMWPTYKLKHPLLSETIKFDFTGAFQPYTWGPYIRRADQPEPHKLNPKEASSMDENIHTIPIDDNPTNSVTSTSLSPNYNDSLHHKPKKLSPKSQPIQQTKKIFNTKPNTNSQHEAQSKSRLERRIQVKKDSKITAKMHNFDPMTDILLQNSIVIKQVTINPVRATYGQYGPTTGKKFCPPYPNFRLRQDHSTRLQPAIMGTCI